jgi:hypothetical protein
MRNDQSTPVPDRSDEGPMTHELKTWPGYFAAILDGRKKFEARVNDRVFREGDTLLLVEYNPLTKERTGRSLRRKVGYTVHVVDRMPDPEAVREHGITVMTLLDEGGST